MHIAMIAPLMEDVPPKGYGGTERVVASLTNALTWAGHSVTVFGTAGSRIDGRLVPCRDRPGLNDPRPCDPVAELLTMLRKVRHRADEFDLLHFHIDTLQFPLFGNIAGKTLTTFHGRLDLVGLPEFFRAYSNFPVVSISDSQRRPLPGLRWEATIPHGYPVDQYRMIPRNGRNAHAGYLAFLGRISPEKGIVEAIRIAQRSGRRLKIAARINAPDQNYWESEVRPLIDGNQIEYIGEIGDHQKSKFLSGADALLFPIQWPEPFGLVMIEAMACGTPVIAFPNGSVSEVIDDGLTGRIVRNVDEAVAAMDNLDGFDRHAIRARFENRFSDTAMAKAYLKVYNNLLVKAPVATADLKNSFLKAPKNHRIRTGSAAMPQVEPRRGENGSRPAGSGPAR